MQSPYTEDYFLRGQETGVSNYTDYRWLEEPTMELARNVIKAMDIKPGETFLDFGCARGYLVKAMRRLGVVAEGHDTSEWAVQNCDPEVAEHVSTSLWDHRWNHIWSKDTLEHLQPNDAVEAISKFTKLAERSILIIVPLCAERGGRYVRDEDEFDKTHVIRGTLSEWLVIAQGEAGNNWIAQAAYHLPGLKPTSRRHPCSCGFITMRRI